MGEWRERGKEEEREKLEELEENGYFNECRDR